MGINFDHSPWELQKPPDPVVHKPILLDFHRKVKRKQYQYRISLPKRSVPLAYKFFKIHDNIQAVTFYKELPELPDIRKIVTNSKNRYIIFPTTRMPKETEFIFFTKADLDPTSDNTTYYYSFEKPLVSMVPKQILDDPDVKIWF